MGAHLGHPGREESMGEILIKEKLLKKLNELKAMMIINVKPSVGPWTYEIITEELDEFKELISKMPDNDLKK